MGNGINRARAAGFLRAALLGGVALSVAGVNEARAQQTAPAAENTSENEVVVTARRPLAESAAAALLVQRQSDSIVSVLSGDAIGRLPDQNIAFAVGRLPGISIERDQGQARYVNLRGAPIYWTTIAFDGLSVVSPEGRSTRFDNIPSAIAKQVIVNKTITADLPADTVAGQVNIITRTAMDYEDFTAFGNGCLGIVTLGGGEEIDASAVIADRFLDGKLGVLLQASFYQRNMVTDNWETDPYLVQTANTGGNRFAREYENKLYRLTRQNQSFSGRVDYEFNDDHKIFVSSVFAQYVDEELRNNYIFRLDQGRNAANLAFNRSSASNGTIAERMLTEAGNNDKTGTVYGARINANFNSLDSQDYISTNTFGGESAVAGWTADWRLNFTQTIERGDGPGLPNFQSPGLSATDPLSRPTVAYDFTRGDDNTVTLFQTVTTGGVLSRGAQVRDIHQFALPLTDISRNKQYELQLSYTAKADFTRGFDLFGDTVVAKFGGFYADRQRKQARESYTATAAQIAAAGLAPITYDNIRLPNKPFLGEIALGYDFDYHSRIALESLAASLVQSGVATRNGVADADQAYKVTEQIFASYAMATINRSWGNVIIGARVERNENTGTALANVNGVRTLVTVSNDETLFYPSAHLNFNVTDEVKLRFGATRTSSRPEYTDIRPNVTINDTARTISGGNPEVEQEKQTGFDAYVEWYLQPEGFLSAGVFYKDVEDVLFTFTSPINSDVFNLNGVDRSDYDFTRVQNGGDGYLAGFEVFAQLTAKELVDRTGLPDVLGGFGISLSGTWVDSEWDVPTGIAARPTRKARILGTSDFTGNIQLIYEKYNFSARLAYQYRTDWGQAIGGAVLVNGQLVPDGNGDTFWDDDGELDLSLRYQLNDNIEWYFDGSNLTDQEARRFVGFDGQSASNYPIELETFGERYLMGLRINY